MVRLVIPSTKTIASRMLDLPLPFLRGRAWSARVRRCSPLVPPSRSRPSVAALCSSRPERRVLFVEERCCLVVSGVLPRPSTPSAPQLDQHFVRAASTRVLLPGTPLLA